MENRQLGKTKRSNMEFNEALKIILNKKVKCPFAHDDLLDLGFSLFTSEVNNENTVRKELYEMSGEKEWGIHIAINLTKRSTKAKRWDFQGYEMNLFTGASTPLTQIHDIYKLRAFISVLNACI